MPLAPCPMRFTYGYYPPAKLDHHGGQDIQLFQSRTSGIRAPSFAFAFALAFFAFILYTFAFTLPSISP